MQAQDSQEVIIKRAIEIIKMHGIDHPLLKFIDTFQKQELENIKTRVEAKYGPSKYKGCPPAVFIHLFENDVHVGYIRAEIMRFSIDLSNCYHNGFLSENVKMEIIKWQEKNPRMCY
jgi:hypothetical protein